MKYKTLLVIFIIAFISSSLLAWNSQCNSGTCGVVQEGFNQGGILGVSNGYIGMAVFLFMSIITFSHIRKPNKLKKMIIHYGLILGSIVSLYLLYLQQFVIDSYCKYCVVIDLGVLIGLIIAMFTWKD